MEQHSVENRALWMSGTIDSCHGSRDDSRNGPGWRLADIHPYKRPSLIQALFGRMSTEVDVGRIVESINVHYKLRVLTKKKICQRLVYPNEMLIRSIVIFKIWKPRLQRLWLPLASYRGQNIAIAARKPLLLKGRRYSIIHECN